MKEQLQVFIKRLGWRCLWVSLFLIWSLFRCLHIELKTSNLDLVDPNSPCVQDFIRATENFGNPSPIVISISGGSVQDLQQAVASLDTPLKNVHGVATVMAIVPPALRPLLLELGADEDDFFMHDRAQKHFYVFVQLEDPYSRVEELLVTLPKLQKALEQHLASTSLQWSWTGMPIYAIDDYHLVQGELFTSTFFALGLVLLVVVLGFKEWKRPLLAMIPLCCGSLSTLAISTIWPGYLTLMSSACFTLLMGMGIDFSIHLLIRMPQNLTPSEIQRQWIFLRRGFLSSTFTSAVVFFLMLTGPFRGFQEFGFLCGVGMLCLLFYFYFFAPRLFFKLNPREAKNNQKFNHQEDSSILPCDQASLERPSQKFKNKIGLAFALLLLGFGILGFLRPVAFNANYLDLQPLNSKTVATELQIQKDSRYHSVFALMTVKGLPEAVKICKTLRENVTLVSEIRSLAEIDAYGERPVMEEHWIKALFKAPDLYSIQIFPAEDIWNVEASKRFNAFVTSFGQPVTGMPILGAAMTEWTHQAFKETGFLALIIVFMVALLDFRNPLTAFLACLPTWISTGLLLLGMDFFGIPMNPISVMAWPIIFGIGIDDGLHWIHAWLSKMDPSSMRRLKKAMVLTSLTTGGAFLSMAFCNHRGMASMSSLLVFGVMLALISTLFVLPLLCSILPRPIFQPLFLKGSP
jgi:predicted RND superfamily exporter protein